MLIVVNYVLTNIVSGVAHLLQVEGARRGYYDAQVWLEAGQLEEIVIIQAIGLIAVCCGAAWGLPKNGLEPTRVVGAKTLTSNDRKMVAPILFVLIPVSAWASYKINSYVATLDTERVIAVSGGMARYSYMSHWLVWAISLLVLYFAASHSDNVGTWPAIALGLGVVAIAASLQWNGGRSIIVVMTLPLILVILPRLHGARFLAIPLGLFVAAVYMVQLTAERSARFQSGSAGFVEWVDWQWGRFSMLGFAQQHADEGGFLFGETILAGITQFLDGVFRLVGLAGFDTEWQSSANVAAESLLRSGTDIYIVPGMSAELFMNFGVVGIICGYFVIGRACGWVDARFANSSTLITQLAWAYIGTLLVFRTIPVDTASAYSYLTFSGAPLLGIALLSYWRNKPDLGDSEYASPKQRQSSRLPALQPASRK
ncbi:hypothetical protein [Mycolicibacterium sp. OfavD-34-C]|uniref:hypothetical protein n=1 Tax=Mycolicibacterium sp. OfavD-34-C TaxID=2917746 RepID=UPI001EF5F9E9|nr:hypothetical protein [Mycolicibacterium sp. OfavD-34-C]MCG7580088.1 hypothetical protein [Mycolicibacterium sp. OfavD-34-C]